MRVLSHWAYERKMTKIEDGVKKLHSGDLISKIVSLDANESISEALHMLEYMNRTFSIPIESLLSQCIPSSSADHALADWTLGWILAIISSFVMR